MALGSGGVLILTFTGVQRSAAVAGIEVRRLWPLLGCLLWQLFLVFSHCQGALNTASSIQSPLPLLSTLAVSQYIAELHICFTPSVSLLLMTQ